MKTNYLITTLIFMTLFIHFSYSQEGNCKVLKTEISTSYSSDWLIGLKHNCSLHQGLAYCLMYM